MARPGAHTRPWAFAKMSVIDTKPLRGRLWRNRNFVLLWVGQGLSDTGGAASALAYPLLVLALTRSPTLAGVVGTIAAGIGVAARVPAGAYVDQFDRRRLMVGCDALRLACLAMLGVLVATSHAWWPLVLAVASIAAV